MAEELGMRLWHIQDDVFAFSCEEWKPVAAGRVARLWRKIRSGVDQVLLQELDASSVSLTFEDHIEVRRKLRSTDGLES